MKKYGQAIRQMPKNQLMPRKPEGSEKHTCRGTGQKDSGPDAARLFLAKKRNQANSNSCKDGEQYGNNQKEGSIHWFYTSVRIESDHDSEQKESAKRP